MRGDRQAVYAILVDRYVRRSEVRVQNLSAEMQSYTPQEGEDLDVFFASLCSISGKCTQVDCDFKDHMLKAKVLGCLTGLYIPLLNQLCTMPSLDLLW